VAVGEEFENVFINCAFNVGEASDRGHSGRSFKLLPIPISYGVTCNRHVTYVIVTCNHDSLASVCGGNGLPVLGTFGKGATNQDGQTALQICDNTGSLAGFRAFPQCGGNPNAEDTESQTPLRYAAAKHAR
jgi:hypothetical protein